MLFTNQKWTTTKCYLKDKNGLLKTVKRHNLELSLKEKSGFKSCPNNYIKTLLIARLNHF